MVTFGNLLNFYNFYQLLLYDVLIKKTATYRNDGNLCMEEHTPVIDERLRWKWKEKTDVHGVARARRRLSR